MLRVYKFNGSRINTKPQTCRWWTVRKDVAEVSIAAGAEDFDASHAMTAVFVGGDIFLREWLEEAGPTCAGIELSV